MDSVSQFALGAALSTAVLAGRTAPWKAALWGGALGTVPDLDTFVRHGDAILDMVRHRAESHSLLYLSLLSLPLGWAGARWIGRTRASRDAAALAQPPASDSLPWQRWWWAAWLSLFTHPLLDWMTVYGTQLAQPFSDHPFGLGSIFIIDPLYTLPLLLALAVALVSQRAGTVRKACLLGLAVSTAYLGWSAAAQQHVRQVVRASLSAQGIQATRVLVTPTPFNTVLWRAVAVEEGRYWEGFYSLLDDDRPMRWKAYDRGAALISTHAGLPAVQRIAAFSHGFYRMGREGEQITLTDLRMGQEPFYTFHFLLGTADELARGSMTVEQRWMRPPLDGALPRLWQRLRGADIELMPPKAPVATAG
ncbi:MAG: metal-dependent hydrolase [Burkholderiaceae bacterium]